MGVDIAPGTSRSFESRTAVLQMDASDSAVHTKETWAGLCADHKGQPGALTRKVRGTARWPPARAHGTGPCRVVAMNWHPTQPRPLCLTGRSS